MFDIFPTAGDRIRITSPFHQYRDLVISGYFPISGFAITRTSATEIAIATGSYAKAGIKASKDYAGGSKTSITAAASGKHRYDLVIIDGADDTLKLIAGVEETPVGGPDPTNNFLENSLPRVPSVTAGAQWVVLGAIRVTESGVTNTTHGTYAANGIAPFRLSGTMAADDTTVTVTSNVLSVKSVPVTSTSFAATSRILGRKTAKAGAGEECTLSEVLDLVGSPVRGGMFVRGASTWDQKAVGTVGQIFKSDGTDPVWADNTIYITAPITVTYGGGSSQAIVTTPTLCEIEEIVVLCLEASATRTVSFGWSGSTSILMANADVPKTLNAVKVIRFPTDEITSAKAIIATVGGSGSAGQWKVWLKIANYQ